MPFARPAPPAPCAVARISLVKPDKARAIEDMLIMAARRGQIQEKVRHGAWCMAGQLCCLPALLLPAWDCLLESTLPLTLGIPAGCCQRRMFGEQPRGGWSAGFDGWLGGACPVWALQVSEARLIELLEQVSEQAEKKTKVQQGLGRPHNACMYDCPVGLRQLGCCSAPSRRHHHRCPCSSSHALPCSAGHHPAAAGGTGR